VPRVEAEPLVGYPLWVSIVGAVVLALVLVGLAWIWWWTRASHPRFGGPPRRDPSPPRPVVWAEPFEVVRARNLDHVAQVAHQFEAGRIDPRSVHLELATVLREHVSSRLRRDVSSLTVKEMRMLIGDGPATATLYAYLLPSFGESGTPPEATRESITAAYEVVQRW
jgi:hypothetical protein